MDIFSSSMILLALFVGFYMAWNIGANDVANAIGTSVGSGALKLKKAVILAAIFEFIGAYFFGSDVAETMGQGIIDISYFNDTPYRLALGMISALLATGLWLQMASFFGWPVSTTHSIVGAIAGFGIYSFGVECLQWETLKRIALSWVISPVAGGILSYALFTWLRRAVFFQKRPLAAITRWAPYIVAMFASVMLLLSFFNLLGKNASRLFFKELILLVLSCACLIFCLTALLMPYIWKTEGLENETADEQAEMASHKIQEAITSLKQIYGHVPEVVKNQLQGRIVELEHMLHQIPLKSCALNQSQIQRVEGFFAWFQCASACFMALSHGANDVSNAVGPLSVTLQIMSTGLLPQQASIAPAVLALGGLGIVVGLATWGWRVIETVGRKITQLTPSRGFCAEFGCATTVLICSEFGLPISTTHVLVGSILGVGLARGISALNLSTLKDIVFSWLITLPIGAFLSMLVAVVLERVFL
jgi:phosphate/sulfate permease